jgi:ADP-ribosylglycohydrolase
MTGTNALSRRAFIGTSAVAAAATTAVSAAAEPAGKTAAAAPGSASGNVSGVTLRDKFFGCIAGVHIGSAMGAVVEGWPYERIEKEHGTLDKFVSYMHYGNGWKREPGTTEDGVERQKLMITAIIEKKDRVTAEDIRKIWVRDIKPESAGKVSEPFEADLLAMAKSPIPATDLGRYCDYSGLVSLSRSCHPIGLINAGDIDGALTDIYEVGQLYQTTNSRGIRWAAAVVVAIAAATKPGATADSVLGAIFDRCDKGDSRFEKGPRVLPEIERALKATESCRDFRAMRREFDKLYSGAGIPYAQSYANEVVTKGVCIFRMVKGNLKDAIVAAVNTGRDTDCLAAVAGGISGSLTGGGSLPEEWIKQSDYATSLNVYTNSQRTLREHSDGLYAAYKARLAKMRTFVDEMEKA